MIRTVARASAWTGWAVALAAFASSAASVDAATPAKAPPRPAVTRSAALPVGQANADITSSIAAAAHDERPCDRSRKRLWVEGEGWVVRKVTTCY